MPKEVCEDRHLNHHRVQAVKENSLKPDEVSGVSEIFKAMGDATRIRILHALAQGELCVCDLEEALGMSQPAVSHQLRVLRNLRLVKNRKEGKKVYYSLDDEHIINLFSQGLAHVRHQ
ncbi:MAG: metalloregulator ArsR/SmtB family transcription factor [Peptococcaceae bacterium]|jgi:ArsR family transcriptional regulator|nr:metalloregulator ArsR/SmtB family transcription factor [Peptococcaceae bacterium]MDH7525042.1 metalloregulator ArsR/SmtB family transcription factor [Peptococcaceae bacterium]